MIPINDESGDDSQEPEVEDAITEALKDVTPEDWDGVPDDLTDRLDHYLYGVVSSLRTVCLPWMLG